MPDLAFYLVAIGFVALAVLALVHDRKRHGEPVRRVNR